MLGDVLFFSVTGFLLINLRLNLLRWYWKRLIRIYPTVWIITLTYIILGFYNFNSLTLGEYLFFPTNYHFIASIVLLYIPYYIILKIDILSRNIPKLGIILFLLHAVIYVLIYDKSYYHIDNVREPMVRFLFFYAMLLGAYFRINKEKFINLNSKFNWIMLITSIGLYFVSKLAFSNYAIISEYQIINQLILMTTLYFIFKSVMGIANILENLPSKIKRTINFISTITLEIYLVQYVIIPVFSVVIFPLNWILITGTIIISATILHSVSAKFISIIDMKNYNKEKTITKNI